MAVLDRIQSTASKTLAYTPENQNARISFSRMSSSELLRFGVSAKFRCSQESTPNDPERTGLAAQLNEARFEWNRRHPDLPLRDSF
jgi:hypothetical protein